MAPEKCKINSSSCIKFEVQKKTESNCRGVEDIDPEM